ncbi:MAG: hypothetical protein MJE66_08800, partial [Proteobacteria bacterium]|nr:hypothetical protein [Pseudomonadota bacterium]
DVAAALVLDETGARAFAGEAPLVTDNRNLLLMRSPAIARAKRPLPHLDLAAHDPWLARTPDVSRAALVRRLSDLGFAGRARRIAEAATTESERESGLAWAAFAEGRRPAGFRHAERSLALAPNRAAQLALLRERRAAVASDRPDVKALVATLGPREALLARALRLAADEGPRALAQLEPEFAAVPPGDLIYRDVTRLRVDWRVATGEPALASQAIVLLDAVLPPAPGPSDLVARAQACATAGLHAGAVRTLFELAPHLGPRSGRAGEAAAAAAVLQALPQASLSLRERRWLQQRFRVAGR